MNFLGEGKRWRWLGDHALVLDEGKRPAVLTTLRQRDSTTVTLASCGDDGRLEPITAKSDLGRALAALPEVLEALSAYQAANRMHNDSEAALFELGAAALLKVRGLESPAPPRDAGAGGREP